MEVLDGARVVLQIVLKELWGGGRSVGEKGGPLEGGLELEEVWEH